MAIFLVATIDAGGDAVVHDALGDISGLVRAIGFRDTAGERRQHLLRQRIGHIWTLTPQMSDASVKIERCQPAPRVSASSSTPRRRRSTSA